MLPRQVAGPELRTKILYDLSKFTNLHFRIQVGYWASLEEKGKGNYRFYEYFSLV